MSMEKIQKILQFLEFLDYQCSDALDKINEFLFKASSTSRKLSIEINLNDLKTKLLEYCEVEPQRIEKLNALYSKLSI